MTTSFDRRALLVGGLAASAATVVPLGQAFAQRRGRVSANDKVQVGLIGCKGMGWSDLSAMCKRADVAPVGLCDVDATVLAARGAELKRVSGRTPKLYDDYRRMLDDKSIDAVIIATPDHWHALQLVDAMSAGKDAYCEKPWAYMGWMKRVVPQPDQAPPAGVDYDSWLGPAPLRPFNSNRFHFSWRWYWDYAGGLMTDWGVHLMDIALLGMKAEAPRSVSSLGGAYGYPGSAMETPDTQTAIYDFGDYSVEWEHAVGISQGPYGGRDHGVAFVGETGTLVVDRGQWRVTPETSDGKAMTREIPVTKAKDEGLDRHTADFIACVKDRARTPACTIEAASNTAIVCQMGNIALRTGRQVNWDAATGQFRDDAEANRLITPRYRTPYRLPAT